MSVLDLVLWAPIAVPLFVLLAKVLIIWFLVSLIVCSLLLVIAIVADLSTR